MRRNIYLQALSILIISVSAESLLSAPPDEWDIEKTVSEASTIVVVKCDQITRVANNDFHPQQLGKYLISAKVVATLRGEPNRVLRVWHYQPLPNADRLGNGPSYLYFSDQVKTICSSLAAGESSSDMRDNTHTLLYLKEGEDGIFVPATGKMFAGHSSVKHDDLGLIQSRREAGNGGE